MPLNAARVVTGVAFKFSKVFMWLYVFEDALCHPTVFKSFPIPVVRALRRKAKVERIPTQQIKLPGLC